MGTRPGAPLSRLLHPAHIPSHHSVLDALLRGRRRRPAERLEHLVGRSRGVAPAPVVLAHVVPPLSVRYFARRAHPESLQRSYRCRTLARADSRPDPQRDRRRFVRRRRRGGFPPLHEAHRLVLAEHRRRVRLLVLELSFRAHGRSSPAGLAGVDPGLRTRLVLAPAAAAAPPRRRCGRRAVPRPPLRLLLLPLLLPDAARNSRLARCDVAVRALRVARGGCASRCAFLAPRLGAVRADDPATLAA